jgi:RNA polymerase sigma-70 factor (ECF subfamily)
MNPYNKLRNMDAMDANEVDPEAWVNEHGDHLFQFALMRLRDRSRAEEAVQDAFLAGLANLDSYSGKSSVRTWLKGILKHKIADQFRALTRDRHWRTTEDESIDDFYDTRGHLAPPAGDWTGDPRSAMEQREFWDCFYACVAKMPNRASSAFMLREIDGLTSEEICKLLDISPTNYWVILHRARISLRRCLELNWFFPREKG